MGQDAVQFFYFFGQVGGWVGGEMEIKANLSLSLVEVETELNNMTFFLLSCGCICACSCGIFVFYLRLYFLILGQLAQQPNKSIPKKALTAINRMKSIMQLRYS